VRSLDDVQRFHVIMATRPEERDWAMVYVVTSDPAVVRKELEEERYVTATRGERVPAAAKPIGEARYELSRRSTRA
jgi:hypothetical protein